MRDLLKYAQSLPDTPKTLPKVILNSHSTLVLRAKHLHDEPRGRSRQYTRLNFAKVTKMTENLNIKVKPNILSLGMSHLSSHVTSKAHRETKSRWTKISISSPIQDYSTSFLSTLLK